MRLFVGTLYAGENEFEECVDSVKRQKGVAFDHIIFNQRILLHAAYNFKGLSIEFALSVFQIRRYVIINISVKRPHL